MRTRLLCLIVFAVLLSTALGCAPEEQAPPAADQSEPAEDEPAPSEPEAKVFEWTGQMAPSAASLWYKNWERFTKRVEAASGGRLVMAVHPGGAIVPPIQEMYGVNDGALDYTIAGAAHYMATVPAGGLLSGYLVGDGLDAYAMRMWFSEDEGAELLEKAFADLTPNVKVFGQTSACVGPEIWGHSTKKLESLDDMQGFKMRTLGDAGEILNRIGASTVSLPPGEIYESLQRGVIDGAENSGPAENVSYGYHEIAEYVYLSETRGPTDVTFFAVAEDVWAELPPDLQEIVIGELWANRDYQLDHNIHEDVFALQIMADAGATIAHLPADIERATVVSAEGFYAEMTAQDPFFAEVYTSMVTWRDRYAEYMELVQPQF